MKTFTLILFLSILALVRCAAQEKCQLELHTGRTFDDVVCQALVADSLRVISPRFRGWISLTAIRSIHLDRSSNIVTGIGLGTISGFIVGYVVGKNVDENAANNGTNKAWTYSLIGGGIGLLSGTIIGALTERQSDFQFDEMTNDEQQELLHDLIQSTKE